MNEKKIFTFENIAGLIIMLAVIGFDLFKSPLYNWIFASIFYAVTLLIKYYIIDKI